MTDQEHLERAYRRLLAWYPRDFRRENEQEILAVLMADAPDGKHRPGPAEATDLIRSGLWIRLRPSVPRSARTVRAAVKLMYAGAAVSTVNLIILLAVFADIKAYHAILRQHLTAAQVSQYSTLVITVCTLWALVPIAVWLWMARACGRGRNWARIVSTVLVGAATLNLTSAFNWLPPGVHLTLVPMVTARPCPCCTGWSAWPWCGCCGAGLPRVLPAAGLHTGPAPGADGRVRPSGADGRTRADQGTVAPSRVSHRPVPAADGRPRQRTSSHTAIPRL